VRATSQTAAAQLPEVHAAESYLEWMRQAAAVLRNPYEDRPQLTRGVSMMCGRVGESHSDPATPQLTVQLCTAGDYNLSADLGVGRFSARRRAGDAIVAPPNQEILLSGGSPNGLEITIMALDWARVTEISYQACQVSNPDFGMLHRGLVRDEVIAMLIRSTWHETKIEENLSCLYLDSVVNALVARLLLLARRTKPAKSVGLAPWQLNRAMDMLVHDCHTELPLAKLAEAVGLSSFHFARAFKASTGMPPHRRQIELRIEKAKNLLSSHHNTVLEVAQAVGYSSEQSFARVFRATTGVSPGYYRRQTGSCLAPVSVPAVQGELVGRVPHNQVGLAST